ncbi:MAG: tripartite tricarboxylate transporter substrate binding protein [Betaproteobacteria bacterium]|nr:tripartite tricarboxylate transporter substrate binding protein [Betaproteobacteria bacterium]
MTMTHRARAAAGAAARPVAKTAARAAARAGMALVIAAGALCLCSAVVAQSFPNKPLKLIVPYPPGGVGDTFGRLYAQQLGERLGQPVLVDNKPGASQAIGAEATIKSPADGYTLFLGSTSSLILQVGARKNLPYDPVRDFAPVSLVFNLPLYLVVNTELPVANVRELIAYGKANPGKLTFASIGAGSTVHLAGEMFKKMAGIEMVHVPYKGSAPALTDIIAGRVSLMFDGGTSALPFVKAGKLRVLGTTDSRRSEQLPEIPTIAESGLPGYEAVSWFGIAAPAGTPKPVLERLAADTAAIVAKPDFKAKFAGAGMEMISTTPEAMAEIIRSGIPRWTRVMRDAGIQAE